MKKFYFLLIVAMAFVACDTKEPTPSQSLKLLGEGATELNFEGWADEVSIPFSSPVNWMIEMDESIDWFTVTPPYGVAGSATINVKVWLVGLSRAFLSLVPWYSNFRAFSSSRV